MARRLGPAAPGPADPETEALRRFRSYAAASLRSGRTRAPALDGVRTPERRVAALLTAWIEAAGELAGDEGPALRRALEPLADRFRLALRGTGRTRRSSGAPRSRRAVTAAIDRVADAFFAIDTESGRIVDANPAAGALLCVQRDALLGVEVTRFVPEDERDAWWTELDAVAEGDEPRGFRARLRDATGGPVTVHSRLSRFRSRGATLALVVARPATAEALTPAGAPP